MQPGDLRRFKDGLIALGATHLEGSTFMVLRVHPQPPAFRGVDILIDGRVETDLGYFWTADSSEVLSAAG